MPFFGYLKFKNLKVNKITFFLRCFIDESMSGPQSPGVDETCN